MDQVRGRMEERCLIEEEKKTFCSDTRK